MKNSRTTRLPVPSKLRAAPHGVRSQVGEERRRHPMQIIAFGAEVVVDDVDEDHQAARMRGRDQRLQFVGRAIACIRRERQHAVVSPVARAREIGERHQLDGRDAKLGQVIQAFLHAAKGACRRKRADVKLVERGLVPRSPRPVLIGPVEIVGVDDFARAMHVIRVESRRRIGTACSPSIR
jgi:hypothetical protein